MSQNQPIKQWVKLSLTYQIISQIQHNLSDNKSQPNLSNNESDWVKLNST